MVALSPHDGSIVYEVPKAEFKCTCDKEFAPRRE